ncbi:polymorphic membrane protein [Chryseobacterium sp. StRB126]|nr:polymorphic membrane protein [Chryseobacterium sp. StRB126]
MLAILCNFARIINNNKLITLETSEIKKDYSCKSLYAIIALLFCSANSSAQLTIPSGNTFTTTENRPLSAMYGHDRVLSVYQKNEMNIPTGSKITGLRYFVQTAYTPVNVPVFIGIKNSGSSTLTAEIYNPLPLSLTFVYNGTIVGTSVAAGKWITLPFSAPFTYTGDHLHVLVGTSLGDAPGKGTTDKILRWHNATAQTQVWKSNTDPIFNGNGIIMNTKPNIQILYDTPGATGTLSLDYSATTMLENRNQVITVNRNGGSTGAVSVDYATSDGTAIAGTDYNAASGTLSWADGDMQPKSFTVTTLPDLAADDNETFSITLSNPTGTTINGNSTSTVTIKNVLPPMAGTYTVGAGGNYPSLTNDGGIFQALNQSVDGVSGPVTINIISDLTGETGKNGLNEIIGDHAVLIQPFGGARSITGNSSGYGSLLKFLGTDNITINGSATGATVGGKLIGGDSSLRELSILGNTSDNEAVIGFLSGTNGAKNNTVKNVNITGGISNTGIGFNGKDNDGNKVENCSVKKVSTGIISRGENVDNQNIGTTIKQNDLSATGTDKILRAGIVLYNDMNPIVSYNKVYVESPLSTDVAGLGIGRASAEFDAIGSGGISGAMVNNNIIDGVVSTNTDGYSAVGIAISGTYTGLPNTLQNNMINNVRGQAKNPSIVAGIFVVGAVASVTKLYNNTISLSGNRGSQSLQYPSYCIALSGLDPSLEMKNNIMSTTQIATGGGLVKTYAFGTASTTFDNLISDYNAFYSGGVQSGGFRTGSLKLNAGTDHATLAAWRTLTTKDANSVGVAPVFVSATDLHLDINNNPLIAAAGTPIPTVTTDIDGEIRKTVNPTIGADEIIVDNLGTDDVRASAKLRIYPNPVKSILNIENDAPIGKVEVFNLVGQKVLNQTVNTNSAQIDLVNLVPGNYLVRVSNRDTVKTFKIIKK